MKFKASLDSIAIAVTVFCIFLFCVFLTLIVYEHHTVFVWPSIPLLILFITIIYCYFIHPSSYWIKSGTLVIKRPIHNIIIMKNEITNYKLLNQSEVKGSIRAWGSGGLFGYFGRFQNRKLGKMIWYVTQRENFVLIQTTKGAILLSPNAPVAFLRALQTTFPI